MNAARLNIFQKTQRLWDTFHPYNAAQAAALTKSFAVDAVCKAFDEAVVDLRLGDFISNGSRYWIESSGPAKLRLLDHSLAETLTFDLNFPFDSKRSFPFRPFVCLDSGRQVIGIVYQHWVADSVSIRTLMRQWIFRLIGCGKPSPMVLPSAGMWQTFGGHTAGWSLTAEVARQFGVASRMKKMRRVESGLFSRGESGVLSITVIGLIDPLKRAAKARGATIGDVFLAAATGACARHGVNLATPLRGDLAMGTIVDLRSKSAIPANVFGLYLGFTTTPFSAAELGDFDSILARAIAQRRTNLNQHAAEASQVRMGLGYMLGKVFGRKSLIEFYRKRFALAGGLSSVNLTPLWPGELFPEIISDYWRVSPPGPFMPIVFTPTTLGDRLTVCCTYRTALFTPAAATRVMEAFTERLKTFAFNPLSR